MRTLSRLARRLIDRYQPSETTTLLLTAILVGSMTGLASVLLIRMVAWTSHFSFDLLPRLAPWLGRGWLILVPGLGALIAGPFLARRFANARASGIPNVMEAMVLRGGRIGGNIAIAKLFLTTLTLGSGGSAGREGPIVQIGSSIGSSLAQFLRVSEQRTRNLVACGAAAGISAAFNAPIAGVAFAIEELGGELGLGMLGNVVMAAVAAAMVSGAVAGHTEGLVIPLQQLEEPTSIFFYALLGILTALWGVLYIKAFYWVNDFFEGWRRPPAWLKPAIGGLMVGLIGFSYPPLLTWMGVDSALAGFGPPSSQHLPGIFGAGFGVIEMTLRSPLPLLLAGALLVFKLLGTSLTLGSGSAGGLFAPSLLMGALLGNLSGQLLNQVFPAATVDPTAFALAGMAGVLTGAVRAPLTSILIVFELTNDYAFILPLMVTTMISAIVAQRLHAESMYSLWLVRRGIHLRHGRDVDILDAVLVNEVMDTNPPTLSPDTTLGEFRNLMFRSHYHGIMVLDERQRLIGVVTLTDLDSAMRYKGWANRPVSEAMTRTLLTAYPDQTIGDALQRMAARDIGRMPVVDRQQEGKMLGIIRRSDIIRAYQRGVVRRQDLQDRANQLRASRSSGVEFLELTVAADSAIAGQRVRDLELPPECLLTTRRHGDKRHLLHGDDILLPGDEVMALVEPERAAELRTIFNN